MWRHWVSMTVVGAAVLGLPIVTGNPQRDLPHERDLTIVATACTFAPARIDVNRNDMVRIEFVAVDAPYSFVIDEYRIAKRATPGHPVRFEFGAVQAGTFDFYSDLANDRCADVRGLFVVTDAGDGGDS